MAVILEKANKKEEVQTVIFKIKKYYFRGIKMNVP